MTDPTTTAPSFDPEAVLTDLKNRVHSLDLAIDEALSNLRGVPFLVPGETTDHLDYRYNRDPNGTLSKIGEDVMLALLKLGLSDVKVGKRMSVAPTGVADRRRRWGRAPGQRG